MPTQKYRMRFFVAANFLPRLCSSTLSVRGPVIYNKKIMSRSGKQLAYGMLFFAILVGMGLFAYFLFIPDQDCGNSRHDWGEEGVDCGGRCAKVCIPADIRPVTISEDPQIFHPTPQRVAMYFRIQNPNSLFAGNAVRYRIEYFDGNRSLGSRDRDTYIYADEVKYVTDFWEGRNPAGIDSATVTILDVDWVPTENFERPDLQIGEKKTVRVPAGLEASGRVVNRSTFDLEEATVVAIFFGSGTIGVSHNNDIGRVPAGEAVEFTVLHPNMRGIDLSRTQFYVYGR